MRCLEWLELKERQHVVLGFKEWQWELTFGMNDSRFCFFLINTAKITQRRSDHATLLVVPICRRGSLKKRPQWKSSKSHSFQRATLQREPSYYLS
jgi:hypothetical protein